MNKDTHIFLGGPLGQYLEKNNFRLEYANFISSVLTLLRTNTYDVKSAFDEGYLSKNPVDEFNFEAIRDFSNVISSQCYIAYWPAENNVPFISSGTCIELGWASAQKIPCIIIKDTNVNYGDLVETLASVTNTIFIDISHFNSNPEILLSTLNRLNI